MSASMQPSWPNYPRRSTQKQKDENATSNDKEENTEDEAEKQTIWQQILEESEKGRRLYDQLKQYSTWGDLPILPKTDSMTRYLDDEVFPTLLPALEKVLKQAKKWDCFWNQRCIFNGTDYLAEILWNTNPRFKDRAQNWTPLFRIPVMQAILKENPREPYPLSWLLLPYEAATIIQAAFRGYLVRRREDVQEVRLFWKALRQEKEEAEIRRRQKERREREKRRQAMKTQLTSQERLEQERQADIQKSAKGFVDRVLELAWQKIRKEEEEWQKSVDREHVEPYMVLRRSFYNWDNMTPEDFEKFFKNY